jgi:hypothetical protein
MYINDLPPRISTLSEPLIFDDDTYVILHKNVDGFRSVLDMFLSRKNKWFTANKCKRLQVLPLSSEYIFCLMNCIANNQEKFQTNSVVCSINSRNEHYLHRPMPTSQVFRKHCTVLVSKDSIV